MHTQSPPWKQSNAAELALLHGGRLGHHHDGDQFEHNGRGGKQQSDGG